MATISSKATFIHKTAHLLLGCILCFVFVAILLSDVDEWIAQIIGMVAIGILACLFFWLGFKSCHVSLARDAINLREVFHSDDVTLNNIYDIIDLWYIYPHLAIVKFNQTTKFGNVILFYPKRTGFINARTVGLDALKRAIGK